MQRVASFLKLPVGKNHTTKLDGSVHRFINDSIKTAKMTTFVMHEPVMIKEEARTCPALKSCDATHAPLHNSVRAIPSFV